jgi:hypothetical protein
MKRRSFIQKSLLLTGGLVVAFKSSFSYSIFGSGVITGKVTAKGKPLAEVLVSDGFSVVKTNSNGVYKLSPDAKAEFVFISIPAGYEFPEEKKLANFYTRITDGQDYDFKLTPLNKNDDKHAFIIWADPQVKNKKDVAQMMATSVPDTRQIIKDMGPDALVHGVCVGDLVWDNHDLFNDYNKAVEQMGIPFFQALGNHDEDYRMGGDETSDRTFKSHYGPTYYSFNRGKAHYMVFDNVRYLGVEREYDGYVTEAQIEWLKKDLKEVPQDHLIIVCLHIPVHNQVKNNDAFYAALDTHKNVHIMSGHTHYQRNVITKNIFEHNHGTVCGAWWTGPICEDGTPRGYGVYHVEGNQLKWYYKSTGEDRTKQIALFGDELTNQKRVIANVWNYDPEWKVEYWADDQPKGIMERQIGFDPLAVKLYLGDQLPVTRSFAEPRKTDHLFVAHLSADTKKIKVVATDRFGEKFESELSI